MRVLLDTTMKTSPKSRLYKEAGVGGGLVVFTTKKAPKKRLDTARAAGARVEVVGATKDGVSMKRVLRTLGSLGVANLLIEGGAVVAASVLKAGLVDRAAIIIAPTFLGGDALSGVAPLGLKRLAGAPGLKSMKVRRLGADLLIEGPLA